LDTESSSFYLHTVHFNTTILIYGIVLLVLLFLSALISGSEIAFFSLSTLDLEQAEKSKSKRFNAVARLLKKPKKLLATILIANNFINIAIIILSTYINQSLFNFGDNVVLTFIIQILVISFLILLFGEVLPKVYANRNSIKFASFMAFSINYLNIILSPISVPLMQFTTIIEKRFRKKNTDLSVEKLSQALELTSENETTLEEHKILEGIVSFGNTETRQVMTPRLDMFALSIKNNYLSIIDKIIKKGFSRIPVYKESLDDILGVLYVKDLLPHLHKTKFDWVKIIRKPFYIPENKKLDDLLIEFKETKIHLAIVVDEYGGTSGVVTLEDIIEEIFGDISDEFDDDELTYSKLDDFNYIFDGKTSLKDFYNIIESSEIDFKESQGEAETLAGFILEISGNFPKLKDKIKYKDYTFTIEAIDKKRIIQVKITLPQNNK